VSGIRHQTTGYRLQVKALEADNSRYARFHAAQSVGEKPPVDPCGLQGHRGLSQGRTIRPEKSDTSVLRLCSSQHRRRLRQGHQRRSGPLSPDSPELRQRAPVPSSPRPRSLAPKPPRPRTPERGSDRDKAHAHILHQEPQRLRQPDLKPVACSLLLKPYLKADA